MTTYDFVHLVLHASGGKIEGRTKLQKIVYFVGTMTGMADDLGYRAHFYGPYSGEVAGAVNDLRGLGFLEQRTSSAGATDPKGFEVTRYDYELTPAGKQIAEDKARKEQPEWDKIKTAVEKLRTARVSDYVQLSIAAKTYFLLREKKGQATPEELQKMTAIFGWKVTPQEIVEAAKLLTSLDLVNVGKPS
jgi:uncharacterized protein YwgA